MKRIHCLNLTILACALVVAVPVGVRFFPIGLGKNTGFHRRARKADKLTVTYRHDENISYETADQEEIARVVDNIEIVKFNGLSMCNCSGQYELVFSKGGRPVQSARLAHFHTLKGISLRGEARLSSETEAWLEEWLNRNGLIPPKEE